MVLAFRPLVVEAGLLKQAAGTAVEEGRRGLLAIGVLRIGLDHSAPCLSDQIKGTVKSHRCDTFPAVTLVNEEASEPNHVHQQPPQTPLCLVHNSTNASQVSLVSGLTRYPLMGSPFHAAVPVFPSEESGSRRRA